MKSNIIKNSFTKAFTMLELVFVIVVIGILAAVIIPRTNSNSLREAAIQVMSHIKYTQHLAMIDDKFNSAADWHKNMWQIQFVANVGSVIWPYVIYSDTSHSGNANSVNEIAKNPENTSQLLTGSSSGLSLGSYSVTKSMALGDKYGITNVSFSGCGSTARRVSFDYLGRPFSGNPDSATSHAALIARVMTGTCEITLTHTTGDTIIIQIEPETGYVHLK